MRASVDPIRDVTLDVLDAARQQATGLVGAGADLLASGIDVQVDRLSATIEDLADKAPVVKVETSRGRGRRPLVVVLVVVVVGAIAFAALKRRGTGTPPSDPSPPAEVRDPVPT